MVRLRIGLLIGVAIILGLVMFGRPMLPNAITPALAATRKGHIHTQSHTHTHVSSGNHQLHDQLVGV